MDRNPYAPESTDDLPATLPIFPLEGVLLLPCGNLPLNIFEPRYLAMVEAAMASNRLIGMVQPKPEATGSKIPTVYDIGCAGKITEFTETEDGRYLINLKGISRFRILKELDSIAGFRQIKPSWLAFEDDLKSVACLDMDRERLKKLLRHYFDQEQMECDWQAIEEASDGKLITCLSMVCPLEPTEKQALLEAKCCKTRSDMFMTMLEMATCDKKEPKSKH